MWLSIGATLFSSNIGAEHFVGLAGSAADTGMSVAAYEWTAGVLLMIIAYFVGPVYLKNRDLSTTPQYLYLRFNSEFVRLYNVIITLIIYVFVQISATLYAGSVILSTILDWDLWTSSFILIFATGIYVVLGGLKAVVYTENLQTIILIFGGLIVMGYSLYHVKWDNLINYQPRASNTSSNNSDDSDDDIQPNYMHLIHSWNDSNWPWPGVTIGIIFQSYYYWCGNHLLVQRVLSSENIVHCKYGAIGASLLKILPVWMMVIPGICARILFDTDNENENGGESPFKNGDYDTAFPLLVTRLLPNGLIGIVVSAMLSALMSSLAAVYNSASTLISYDLFKKYYQNRDKKRRLKNSGNNGNRDINILDNNSIDDKRLVVVGRISAVIFVIVSLLWLPMIKNGNKELFVYCQNVSTYIQTPLSVLYFSAHFLKFANKYGAISCIVTGFIFGMTRFIIVFFINNNTNDCKYTKNIDILYIFCQLNFLYFGLMLVCLCGLSMIIGSLIGKKFFLTNEELNEINANLSDLVYSKDLVKNELANIELSHHYIRSGDNDDIGHEPLTQLIEMAPKDVKNSSNNSNNSHNSNNSNNDDEHENVDEMDPNISIEDDIDDMDDRDNGDDRFGNNIFERKEEEFIVEQFDDISENKCKKCFEKSLNGMNTIRNLSCFGNNTRKLLACSNLFAFVSMVLLLIMWILFW